MYMSWYYYKKTKVVHRKRAFYYWLTVKG